MMYSKKENKSNLLSEVGSGDGKMEGVWRSQGELAPHRACTTRCGNSGHAPCCFGLRLIICETEVITLISWDCCEELNCVR